MCGPPGTPSVAPGDDSSGREGPPGTASLNHTLRFHVNFGLIPLGKTAD